MHPVSLVPVLQATTMKYFIDEKDIAPWTVEFGADDHFKRGIYQTSALKVGEEIPFTLLCKLSCDQWGVNDRLCLNDLGLKEIFFRAVNKVTGKSSILTMGSLFGVCNAVAMRPNLIAPTDNRIINFSMRYLSTKLLKDYHTGNKTDIFGDEEGQTISFSFIGDINHETLTSSAEVTKCSNPDVELTIVGFNLRAFHQGMPELA